MSTNKAKTKTKAKNNNNKKKSVIVTNTPAQQQGHMQIKPNSITWPPEGDYTQSVSPTIHSQDQKQELLSELSQNMPQDSKHELSSEQNVQVANTSDANPSTAEADESVALKEMKSSDSNPSEALPQDKAVENKENSEKDKNGQPSDSNSISLENKSDQFKAIIEFALKYEKLEEEQKKLKTRINKLTEKCKNLEAERKKVLEDNKKLTATCKDLNTSLDKSEALCAIRLDEINKLKSEVEHRNEVIDIVRADRTESAQEYKNSLVAALKPCHNDYIGLKDQEMNDDVGAGMSDILEDIFKILKANGIVIA